MDINSDAKLALLAPATRTCDYMPGTLYIRNGVSNGTLLAEAFPNLRVVTGGIDIFGNPNLATLDGSFPNLQTVGETLNIQHNANLVTLEENFQNLQSVGGEVNIVDNANLASIDGSFSQLQTVGSDLRIHTNPSLNNIGSSFASIRSIGVVRSAAELYWYGNGGQYTSATTPGSRSFCASARGALCPTTTSWSADPFSNSACACCYAYCTTSTDCTSPNTGC